MCVFPRWFVDSGIFVFFVLELLGWFLFFSRVFFFSSRLPDALHIFRDERHVRCSCGWHRPAVSSGFKPWIAQWFLRLDIFGHQHDCQHVIQRITGLGAIGALDEFAEFFFDAAMHVSSAFPLVNPTREYMYYNHLLFTIFCSYFPALGPSWAQVPDGTIQELGIYS